MTLPKILSFFIFCLCFISFRFPENHTFHPEFGVEWCYFVGELKLDSGQQIGYELSFFRSSLGKLEIFPVHFAISDISQSKHYTFQASHRKLGGMAGYNPNQIWSGEYKLEIVSGSEFRILAEPKGSSLKLDLRMKAKGLPMVHGNAGLSRKSRNNPKIYSYYYSIPRLESTGTFTDIQGKTTKISGLSWMDHEWSAEKGKEGKESLGFQLGSTESGWDWVFLHSEDGSNHVFFQFREKKESISEAFGTLQTKEGSLIAIEEQGSVVWTSLAEGIWESKLSKKKYPLHWKIKYPSGEWTIQPRFQEQEFDGRATTGIVYWEGLVDAHGFFQGKPVKATGYLELKGR